MKNTIGQNIAHYRKKAEMTQADLAEKMNVSVQAVSKWENDVSYPDIERIGQLAKVLSTSAENIINGENFVPTTELKSNCNINNRLLLITLKVTNEQPVDVTLKIPVTLVLEAHENGTLDKLIGDECDEIPDAVFEMIRSGVVGPIADVKTEDTEAKIEVIDYDN